MLTAPRPPVQMEELLLAQMVAAVTVLYCSVLYCTVQMEELLLAQMVGAVGPALDFRESLVLQLPSHEMNRLIRIICLTCYLLTTVQLNSQLFS